ncbi:MAG: Mut7-C RNAse domain-containing protein [Candidatus Halalkalibacterium sp. M3_1C_030]
MIRINILGSLTDFLSGESGDHCLLTVYFELNPSIKDLIEAEGIPHTAIFKITVNGIQKGLDYNVASGDKIEAFPFEMVDTKKLDSVYSTPSAFIADGHLTKLGQNLRLLGLDTLIEKDTNDSEIIRRSNRQKRMIVTRDKNLLRHGSAKYGYWVRNEQPDRQLNEILSHFDLRDKLKPFSRCMTCNGLLEETTLSEVSDKVPPKVREWCSQFQRCRSCGKVYWKGSHYEKLKEKVEQLIEKKE